MVCSPPYPNAYSYHLYHMTRMIWLGMDQPKFKREEIGSHRKYSSKGRNGATVDTFKAEFEAILRWLSRSLKKGGYACFVVGDSTLKGLRVSNANLISEIARDIGFSEALRIDRTMQDTKKAFNPAIGKIKTEKILILENRGAMA
jgi:site-specific DNA-methyltransferase (cytosine-N4-specific)